MMAIKVEQNNAIELSGIYNTTITQDCDNKVLPPNVTVSRISPIMETEMIATTLWILECLFFVHNGEKSEKITGNLSFTLSLIGEHLLG
jgi:hypothetical protein